MDLGGEWQTVMKDRKQNILEEKNSLVKEKGNKGVTKPLSKFFEAERMEEQIEEVTGLEVASVLGQMSQRELPEVADTDNAPPELFCGYCFKKCKRKMKRKAGHQ